MQALTVEKIHNGFYQPISHSVSFQHSGNSWQIIFDSDDGFGMK